MRNILVTGGAGYIGSILSFYLLNKNLNVFIIDNLSRGHKKLINKKASFFKLSLKNSKEIRKIVIQKKIDTVIHLAAFIKVDESIKNPSLYLKNNVEGTISLIESVKNTLVKRLIFSSSSSVYGKTKKKIIPFYTTGIEGFDINYPQDLKYANFLAKKNIPKVKK